VGVGEDGLAHLQLFSLAVHFFKEAVQEGGGGVVAGEVD
jgi:hypothetical protein